MNNEHLKGFGKFLSYVLIVKTFELTGLNPPFHPVGSSYLRLSPQLEYNYIFIIDCQFKSHLFFDSTQNDGRRLDHSRKFSNEAK